MEEVVASQFNISDYIWYIVGGVALFFVLVGFIADKSGLAKKTFSKDSNVPKKTNEAPVVPVVPVLTPENSNNIVEPVKNEVPVTFEETNVEPLYNINQEVIINDDFENETLITENSEQLDQNYEETLESLSNQSLSSTNDSEFMLDETEDMSEVSEANLEESSELANSISNIKESDLETVNDSEFMLDEIEANNEAIDNNSDDVWGLDLEDSHEKEEEVELPKLDDVNSDEEDVWKF